MGSYVVIGAGVVGIASAWRPCTPSSKPPIGPAEGQAALIAADNA